MKKLRVDVWSDIACPWCYVGKRRFEGALAAFAHAAQVELVWRAFELDPAAPPERDEKVSYAARLADKYGSSLQEAEGMISRMTDTAREDGLDFHFEKIRPGNTFDAHRVLHLAHERGLQDAVKERLLAAYLSAGEPIGAPETIVRAAVDAGLDAREVEAVLSSQQHADAVRADEREAREKGIQGVPVFVFGGRYALSGAQPSEVILRVLEKAWSEEPDQPEAVVEGAVCGPDGCA